jgi:hypothetical protein
MKAIVPIADKLVVLDGAVKIVGRNRGSCAHPNVFRAA